MDPQQIFVTDYWRRVLNIPAKLIKTANAEAKADKPDSTSIQTPSDSYMTSFLKMFGVYTTQSKLPETGVKCTLDGALKP